MIEKKQAKIKRLRIEVRGIVQGVGFRPFVYACAVRCGLSGFVGNKSSGVFIEVEGDGDSLMRFHEELTTLSPPLAHIEEVTANEIETTGADGFIIVKSEASLGAQTLISPDISICDHCLAELFDPDNHRYRYPFINCTNCGPRFTIIKEIPYDRPLTTMAEFTMCAKCHGEYDDPLDRRFHAQPNACPSCGPVVEFFDPLSSEKRFYAEDAIQAFYRAALNTQIVGVKGVGGFHLVCDARSDSALQRLRERKGRIDKPFAVMARDLKAAMLFAEIDERERELLLSKERPIVLLRKKKRNGLSEAIAPGNNFLGVMLPYSPLHHLLLNPPNFSFEFPDILVMTSGNLSDEPIVTDNEEALESLSSLADAFLLHNRRIHLQCDDSVVRLFEGHELPIRRSRGYAPFPVKLPYSFPPTLAVGGELKSAFCLIKGDHALMSQHIGDMENLETLHSFETSVEHYSNIYQVRPEIVAADKHPRYLSTQWAKAQLKTPASRAARFRQVQHHHAHIAAVMAENGLRGDRPVIGFAFDGTGYGDDGAIWGGEVLIADYGGYVRAAHLRYVPLPGGDVTIKRPYRAALAYLWDAGIEWDESLPAVAACPPVERKVLLKQLQADLNCIPTSSMGRLFDAVAAIAGVRQIVTYEAQAAIEFESVAASGVRESYPFRLLDGLPNRFPEVKNDDNSLEIEPSDLIRCVAEDVMSKVPVSIISAKFHNSVAEVILNLALRIKSSENLNQVALSGGVFQNVTILKAAVDLLRSAGFEVITHRFVPPNDGGLALGQAVIANFLSDDAPSARVMRPKRGGCY